MSFTTIRHGILAVTRKAVGFTRMNTTLDDYEVLNKGVERAAVLRFIDMSQTRDAFDGGRNIEWQFGLKVYRAFDSDVPAVRTAQIKDRESIIEVFRKYPQLDGVSGVFDCMISSLTPEPEAHQTGTVSFWADAYVIAVVETISLRELE